MSYSGIAKTPIRTWHQVMCLHNGDLLAIYGRSIVEGAAGSVANSSPYDSVVTSATYVEKIMSQGKANSLRATSSAVARAKGSAASGEVSKTIAMSCELVRTLSRRASSDPIASCSAAVLALTAVDDLEEAVGPSARADSVLTTVFEPQPAVTTITANPATNAALL